MIDISTIVKSINKETTIETELTLTSFESRLGDYPILKKQPISLHISNVENAAVHITGTVDIDIAIPCSRCLEEVPTNMHFDIDKTLKITDGALVDEEMEETDYLIAIPFISDFWNHLIAPSMDFTTSADGWGSDINSNTMLSDSCPLSDGSS